MSERRRQARGARLEVVSGGGDAGLDAMDAVEALLARARRLRRRGEMRRAITLLREACMLDERRARSWTLLGAALWRSGRLDEAANALKQARYLRARAGERGRAGATERLLERILAAA